MKTIFSLYKSENHKLRLEAPIKINKTKLTQSVSDNKFSDRDNS